MDEVASEGLAWEWLYREHFDSPKRRPRPTPKSSATWRSLVAAASGDGELSDAERRWILGYITAKGYPASVVAEIANLSAVDVGSLPDLMSLGILQKSGRISSTMRSARRASTPTAAANAPRCGRPPRCSASTNPVVALEQLVAEEHAQGAADQAAHAERAPESRSEVSAVGARREIGGGLCVAQPSGSPSGRRAAARRARLKIRKGAPAVNPRMLSSSHTKPLNHEEVRKQSHEVSTVGVVSDFRRRLRISDFRLQSGQRRRSLL
jgi:hypothetical protein